MKCPYCLWELNQLETDFILINKMGKEIIIDAYECLSEQIRFIVEAGKQEITKQDNFQFDRLEVKIR